MGQKTWKLSTLRCWWMSREDHGKQQGVGIGEILIGLGRLLEGQSVDASQDLQRRAPVPVAHPPVML